MITKFPVPVETFLPVDDDSTKYVVMTRADQVRIMTGSEIRRNETTIRYWEAPCYIDDVVTAGSYYDVEKHYNKWIMIENLKRLSKEDLCWLIIGMVKSMHKLVGNIITVNSDDFLYITENIEQEVHSSVEYKIDYDSLIIRDKEELIYICTAIKRKISHSR